MRHYRERHKSLARCYDRRVLLNLDAGERDDESEALWRQFDILAIACGGHAGDAASMERVVRACVDAEISVGAHPSYPDRQGFGRRAVTMSASSLAAEIARQCEVLAAIAERHGTRVDYVKPHGALYHDAARDSGVAAALVTAVRDTLGVEVAIIGPPSGAIVDAVGAADLAYLREGFADRRIRDDGTLVPRGEPGALIVDPTEAVIQARALASIVDTICVHADTPGALAIARALRASIES